MKQVRIDPNNESDIAAFHFLNVAFRRNLHGRKTPPIDRGVYSCTAANDAPNSHAEAPHSRDAGEFVATRANVCSGALAQEQRLAAIAASHRAKRAVSSKGSRIFSAIRRCTTCIAEPRSNMRGSGKSQRTPASRPLEHCDGAAVRRHYLRARHDA